MAGMLAKRVAVGVTNPRGTQTTISDDTNVHYMLPKASSSTQLRIQHPDNCVLLFPETSRLHQDQVISHWRISSLHYTLCSSSSPWKMLVSYLPDLHCGRKDDYKLGLSLEEEHTRPQLGKPKNRLLAKPWCTNRWTFKKRHKTLINIMRWNSTVTSHRNTRRYSTNRHKAEP